MASTVAEGDDLGHLVEPQVGLLDHVHGRTVRHRGRGAVHGGGRGDRGRGVLDLLALGIGGDVAVDRDRHRLAGAGEPGDGADPALDPAADHLAGALRRAHRGRLEAVGQLVGHHDVLGVGVEDLGGLGGGEALEGREQEGLARARGDLHQAARGVVLTLDGQIGYAMQARDRVVIRKSRTTFNLVQPPNRNYFDVLRNKLKWGR